MTTERDRIELRPKDRKGNNGSPVRPPKETSEKNKQGTDNARRHTKWQTHNRRG